MYDKGLGVPQNYQTALRWYRLAAEQGYAEAQFNLGHMYNDGVGVDVLQNYQLAIKWYTIAAKQGLAEAQHNLGMMHARGQGVIDDYVTAYAWINIAASDGIEISIKMREDLLKLMSAEQITEARELARRCLEDNYKNCTR